jgi:hypothetical protein
MTSPPSLAAALWGLVSGEEPLGFFQPCRSKVSTNRASVNSGAMLLRCWHNPKNCHYAIPPMPRCGSIRLSMSSSVHTRSVRPAAIAGVVLTPAALVRVE